MATKQEVAVMALASVAASRLSHASVAVRFGASTATRKAANAADSYSLTLKRGHYDRQTFSELCRMIAQLKVDLFEPTAQKAYKLKPLTAQGRQECIKTWATSFELDALKIAEKGDLLSLVQALAVVAYRGHVVTSGAPAARGAMLRR